MVDDLIFDDLNYPKQKRLRPHIVDTTQASSYFIFQKVVSKGSGSYALR